MRVGGRANPLDAVESVMRKSEFVPNRRIATTIKAMDSLVEVPPEGKGAQR